MESQGDNGETAGRRAALPDPARVRAAKIRLIDEGRTAAAWARANDENVAIVHKVLSGTRPCTTGDALRVARKLGIVDLAAINGTRTTGGACA